MTSEEPAQSIAFTLYNVEQNNFQEAQWADYLKNPMTSLYTSMADLKLFRAKKNKILPAAAWMGLLRAAVKLTVKLRVIEAKT